MSRARWSSVVCLVGVACTVPLACSSPSKGALILAISTDMQTPKDIDIISVFVATDGVAKFDYIGRVLPNGTVSLPSTLAIVEPDKPSAQVRVRVIAFQKQSARVLRDVLTTVPHQRTSLLRVPLNFLDDGSGIGTLPSDKVPAAGHLGAVTPQGLTDFDPDSIASKCDFGMGQTEVAGTCVDATIDSSSLPAYDDSEVFGPGGGASGGGSCFDVSKCFAHAQPVPNVDMGSCSFPLPQGADGARWNCALATPDNTGACAGGTCLVPLETDANEGFTVQGGTIAMVPGVCAKLKAGAQLVFDNSGACPQKVEADPVCEPTGGGSDAGASCDGTYNLSCGPGTCSGAGCGDAGTSCNGGNAVISVSGTQSSFLSTGGSDGGASIAGTADPVACTVAVSVPVCQGSSDSFDVNLRTGVVTITGPALGNVVDGGLVCSGSVQCTYTGCTVTSGSGSDAGAEAGKDAAGIVDAGSSACSTPAPAHDGGCNAAPLTGAPTDVVCSAGSPAPCTGGTVVDGTYVLSSATLFGGCDGGASTGTETIAVCGSTWYLSANLPGLQGSANLAVNPGGTFLNESSFCGSAGYSQLQYSATSTALTIVGTDSLGNQGQFDFQLVGP